MTKEADPSNWFLLAMAFWQKRDKDEARRWFDKGVARIKANDPKNAEPNAVGTEAAKLLGQTVQGTKGGATPAQTRPGTAH